MERGLAQRVTALNRFIHDVYHEQEIIRAGPVPADQIFKNAQFRPEMMGVDVPGGVYSHIAGIDIVRAANADGSGSYYVLEDNLRVPSGVSYMLENRKMMMMRLFPELFSQHRVEPVAHYPDMLLETLRAVAPAAVNEPTVVRADARHVQQRPLRARLPGAADGRGAGRRPGPVRRATTSSTCAPRRGPKRVDVIYRRVDDDFLDPLAFRPDSRAGCAGLLSVYRAGNVTLQRHRHRRGRRQVDLPLRAEDGRVLPRREAHPQQRAHLPVPRGRRPGYVLDHLGELVVKEVHGAGGYGMLVGPAATQAEIAEFRKAWRPTRPATSRSRR